MPACAAIPILTATPARWFNLRAERSAIGQVIAELDLALIRKNERQFDENLSEIRAASGWIIVRIQSHPSRFEEGRCPDGPAGSNPVIVVNGLRYIVIDCECYRVVAHWI